MNVGSRDLLDADDAFMLCLMGEHRGPATAVRSHRGTHIGLAVAVDDDAAAIGLHAERFEAKVLDIALHADGGDQTVRGDRLDLAILRFDMGSDEFAPFSTFETLASVMIFRRGFSSCLRAKVEIRIFDRHDVRISSTTVTSTPMER